MTDARSLVEVTDSRTQSIGALPVLQAPPGRPVMRRDPLEQTRRAAWDGLRMAADDLMGAFEWVVIGLALLMSLGGIFR